MITKSPSCRQVIILIDFDNSTKILANLLVYIVNINSALRNIKSNIITNFIHNDYRGLIITTNNITSSLDLSIIKKYVKNIDIIQPKSISFSHLLQSKFYLKILDISYFNKISKTPTNSSSFKQVIQSMHIFNNICLALKPHVIKKSPKSNMAVVWIDIRNAQSKTNTKSLINRLFNIGFYITTIHSANMNLGIPQCKNCWK